MLYTTLEVVRIAALLAQPVMPESTGKLLDLLGQPDDQRTFAAIGTRLAPGTALPAPVGVFPRYQDGNGVTRITSCHVSTVGGVLRA